MRFLLPLLIAAASLTACAGDEHVAPIGNATASVTEAAVAGDVAVIEASIAGGTSPARALVRLDGRVLALRVARSAFDTAQLVRGGPVDPLVVASREATDRAAAGLRARLVEMIDRP